MYSRIMSNTELLNLIRGFKNYLKQAQENEAPVALYNSKKAQTILKETPQPKIKTAPVQQPVQEMQQSSFSDMLSQTKEQLFSTQEEKLYKEIKNVPDNLEQMHKMVLKCKACPLGLTRLNAVFGEGRDKAKLMFIGEGPGFVEDHKGRPFVGPAGDLLTKMIIAMGQKREDTYITNIVKCHPMIDASNPERRSNDRKPTQEEADCCRQYLNKQIEIIQPKIIVSLGAVAAQILIETTATISSLRGKFYDYPPKPEIKIMPTYHPSALLRNPDWKPKAWADLKMVMAAMAKDA